MTDRYTKIVLTVIAVTLMGMLAAQLTPAAHAQGQACGTSTPCQVVWYYAMPVKMQ
jgi:hypothetical protein